MLQSVASITMYHVRVHKGLADEEIHCVHPAMRERERDSLRPLGQQGL